MIKITRERLPSGGVRIEMTGHAGAERNEDGHDLVCAAASCIAYMLADAAHECCARPEICMESGLTVVKGTPRLAQRTEFETAMEHICRGFELLQMSYPGCVEVGVWI